MSTFVQENVYFFALLGAEEWNVCNIAKLY